MYYKCIINIFYNTFKMTDTDEALLLKLIEDFENKLNEADREFFRRLPLDLKQKETLIHKLIAEAITDEEE